ncbi:hypothetical protein TRAPUB_10724, partial [Trametes pubescens]
QDDTGSITTSSSHEYPQHDAATLDGSQPHSVAEFSEGVGASSSAPHPGHDFNFGGQLPGEGSGYDALDGYEPSRSSRAASPSPVTTVNPQNLSMPHAADTARAQEMRGAKRAHKRQRTEKDEEGDDTDAPQLSVHREAAADPLMLASPFHPPHERKQSMDRMPLPPPLLMPPPPPPPAVFDDHRMAMPPPYPTAQVHQHETPARLNGPVAAPQPQLPIATNPPFPQLENQPDQATNLEMIVQFLYQENGRLRLTLESLMQPVPGQRSAPSVADMLMPNIEPPALSEQQARRMSMSQPVRCSTLSPWTEEQEGTRTLDSSIHANRQCVPPRSYPEGTPGLSRRAHDPMTAPMGPNRAPQPNPPSEAQFALSSSDWRLVPQRGAAREEGQQPPNAHVYYDRNAPPSYFPMDVDGAGQALARTTTGQRFSVQLQGNPLIRPQSPLMSLREERFAIIASLGLTPTPGKQFPPVHHRSPRDRVRQIYGPTLDEWKGEDEGTKLLYDVFGVDDITDEQARAIRRDLLELIFVYSGHDDVVLYEPSPTPPNVKKWEAGTAWPAANLGQRAVEAFLQQYVLSTPKITVIVYKSHSCIPRYVDAIRGFSQGTAEEVRTAVWRALRKEPHYTAIATLAGNNPDYSDYDKAEAADKIIDSLDVVIRPIRIGVSHFIAAFIYIDPPTQSAKEWKAWRLALRARVFTKGLGRATLMSHQVRCVGCHGADHQSPECPFNAEDIPGWHGTIKWQPGRAGNNGDNTDAYANTPPAQPTARTSTPSAARTGPPQPRAGPSTSRRDAPAPQYRATGEDSDSGPATDTEEYAPPTQHQRGKQVPWSRNAPPPPPSQKSRR